MKKQQILKDPKVYRDITIYNKGNNRRVTRLSVNVTDMGSVEADKQCEIALLLWADANRWDSDKLAWELT